MRHTSVAQWRRGWTALVLTVTARAALAMLASLLLWSVLPAALGWHTTVVMSDSMAPRLRVGDIVASRPVAADQLRIGQVLLVEDPDHPGRLRQHRLVQLSVDGRLVLRGDANRANDSTPVARAAVRGVGSVMVPYVGAPAYWVATGRTGRLVLAGAGLLALAEAARVFRPQHDSGDADDDLGNQHGDADGRGSPGSVRRVAVALAAAFVIGGMALAPSADAATRFGATTSTNAGWTARTVPSPVLTCAIASNSLTLQWSGVAGVTGYSVHYGTNGATVASAGASTTSYSLPLGSSGTAWVTADAAYAATTWMGTSNQLTYTVAHGMSSSCG